MKDIIDFLHELQRNNNREWFNSHKSEYISLQGRFNAFVEELIHEVALFEPDLTGLTVKDCTYRIYRDMRFSTDKSPYKTHMGAYICRGGKKSGYSGYYFQISAGKDRNATTDFPVMACDDDTDSWTDKHFLAVGDYCCDSKVLQILREDIANGEGDFEHIVNGAASGFYLERENMLKRNPKGFPADAPYSEYLRLKYFCLMHPVDEDFVYAPCLAQRLAGLFKTAKPFIDYINRAIDYAKELH